LKNEKNVIDSKILTMYGTVQKNILICPCVNLGYTKRKNISSMTARKYQEGISTRLLVARETLKSSYRAKLPIIIVNLDGVTGYFDE